MIQKSPYQNPDQKRILEFNALDFRNILEEIPFPILLINNMTGQVTSANYLFSELVQIGLVEITGLNISEIIPSFDLKNLNDGEKTKVILPLKNDQTLEVEMNIRFMSQSENLLMLLFENEKSKKKESVNQWEIFTKAQSAVFNRIIKISFEELLQEIIEIGKQITFSDEVVLYISQQNIAYLKRFHSNSDFFPDQVPALELSRIKEIDYWEPGKRVLSEIHRVGRLNKFNSIITIPISCTSKQFGLIISALKNQDGKKPNKDLMNHFAFWVSSIIELHDEFHRRGIEHSAIIEKAEKLELFFNNSNDCLLLLNGKNQILEFNSNFLKLFDYLPVELLNKNIDMVFDNSPLLNLLNKQKPQDLEHEANPLDVYNRHGIKKSVFSKVVLFGLGEEEKKLVILKDATDFVVLENNLSNLQKNAALGEVLAEFSHDVRNIINRITTGLQLLVKKINPDESAVSSFQDLQNECIEMTDLMESVLSFSRQDYEKFKSENIKEMIERIFYRFQKSANQANISLILNLISSENLAWCDQRSLERVFNNLINNGIEAIGKGGGAVSVNMSDSEEHPGFLLLQIADTGPGIPPDIQSNLYQKFSSGKSQGTGLGLFISQKIIEYHKGWINLDTFPGGTIFNIYLPKEKRGNAQ
jgi:signal transduction histidine kinase